MRQCPNCSNLVEEDKPVCTYCGYVFNNEGQKNSSNTSSENQYGQFTAVPPKTNGFAIASMVLGIVSIPLVCCCYIGALPAVLAIVFGFVARNKISNSNGSEKGNGMALAGIILGFAALAIIAVLLVISMAFGYNQDFMQEFEKNFKDQMQQYKQ